MLTDVYTGVSAKAKLNNMINFLASCHEQSSMRLVQLNEFVSNTFSILVGIYGFDLFLCMLGLPKSPVVEVVDVTPSP